MRSACTARIQGLKACAAPPAGRSRLTAPPLRDRRHDGPVWQVAWAHPKFGTLLASCSFPQHGRDGLARSSPCGHPSLQEPTPITQGCSPWAREEILRRGRAACREEAAAAPWCLPKGPPISPHSRPSRYDRQIFVWKEHTPGQWGQVYQCREHEGSVNSIAWCPVEHGLCLACASSDGRVSVLTRQADDSWTVKRFNAHNIGCNAVSWAPAFPAGAVLSAASPTGAALQPMRLVTGGCDNLVKIWRCAALPPPPPPPPSPPGRHLQTRWRFSSQVR